MPTKTTTPQPTASQQRNDRLKAALRANLRRRKEADRAVEDPPVPRESNTPPSSQRKD